MKESSLWARNEQDEALAYPQEVYPLTAGIIGGLLGGAAMVPPALAYGLISGKGLWYPVNLIAGAVFDLRGVAEEQLGAFNPQWFAIALIIHVLVSLALGLLFVVLLTTLPGPPALWALVIGPLLWVGATVVVLPAINPAMSERVDWASFLAANVIYSLVLGLWVGNTPRVPARESYSLAVHLPTFLARKT
jgi:hypothetical protein